MIINTLEQADSYYSVNPFFEQAFAFLKQPGLAELSTGKYQIDGNRLFCNIAKESGRTREEARLEAHQKYIDIQYVISGTEEMGWKQISDCSVVRQPYDPAKDVAFFKDEPEIWETVRPGSFAIFFPEDAHAPLVSNGEIHKAVVKVLMNS
ncbi:YhcH/YjgK/YiaL family protein [Sedimentisphaera salicampi]|uniref:Toxin-antitoxin biofilm protein TabA n=1 Tax=Sedimentisphaera salicampi TaxID=1941349 RepID=A0A1W6LLS6_9BACT|nr:YhcH/YjgK/YiaL family protein [Sedimentisphaera salicampi]ARN56717.1 Toxin-antitoxin biofilm protein TabA [Sedimentisphaera salicampi]OXU15158.1 Toxin-antitoxin biofilm protein TabA [Sedimentisphaera salicampi]